MNGLQPSAIEQAPVQTGIQAVPVTASPVTAPVFAPSPAQQYTSITPQSTVVNLPSVKQSGTGEMVGQVGQSLAAKYIGKAAVSAVKGYLASVGTGAYATGGALGFSALPSLASAGTAAAGTAAAGTGAYAAGGALGFSALPSVSSGAAATGTLGSAAAGAGAALGTIAAYAGPMALGYFGGTMMSKVTGGNPTGSGIGGAVGVGIGLAAGLGPVGLLLAGIAGSAIGGLFGNKKPSGKAAGGGFDPFTGKMYGFESKGQDNVGAWQEQKGRIVSSVDRMQTILKLEDKIFEDTGFMQQNLGFNRMSFEVSSRDATQFHLDPLQQASGAPVEGGQRQTLGSYGVGDFDTLQNQAVRGIANRLATSQGLSIEQKYRDRILNSKAKSVSDFLDDLEFGLNREDMPQAGSGGGSSIGTITDDQSFEEFLRTWNQSR